MGAAPSAATLPTPPSPPAPASPITTSTSTSSPSSPTTPAMPPCHMEITSTPRTVVPPSARRSFRSLLRSRSVTQAVMQGEPRPSDVAPTDELLTSDMAHCPVVLTDSGAARYYNLTVPLPGRRRHSIGTFLSKERDNAAAAASSSPRTEASTTTPGHEEAAPCSSSTSTKKRTTSNSSTSSYKDHCRTSHARRRCPKCSSKALAKGWRIVEYDEVTRARA